MMNILAVSQELAEQGYPKMISIPEAALYALIGFAIVFMGIAFLIGVVWAVGKLMQMKSGEVKKAVPQEKKTVSVAPAPVKASVINDEVDEETVAVITAAIMAYYEQSNGPKCEFKVKRIKRI